MSQHLRAFARDLIKREGGTIEVGTLTHVFTNLGNALPGDDAEAQREHVRAELRADEGLAHNEEHDCFSLAPAKTGTEE